MPVATKGITYFRGRQTLAVGCQLFQENRRRLCEQLKKSGVKSNTAVVLQSGKDHVRYNTDTNVAEFRQESFFLWTFGVTEPDCYGILHPESGQSTLIAPKLHPDFAIWLGSILPEQHFTEKYGLDGTHFSEENDTVVSDLLKKLSVENVLLLKAPNSDSGLTLEPAKFNGMQSFTTDTTTLYPIITELRVLKTDLELDVMRYACKIGSDAHVAVMKAVKPGMYEYQAESLFRHHGYFHGGCRHCGYTCIGGSGTNGAILHYGHAGEPNAKQILEGDMCLFDMGPEYCGYTSDITTSFPANGKFSEKQKMVYNAVLAANLAVFEAAKPGVRYTDMHLLSERTLLSHLLSAGLLTGDVDAMMDARLGAVFMPHGLGHLLGLDVHDVGGYLGDATPRSKEPGLKSLRLTRTLKERMVLTIEPGCYFIDTLLDAALADPIKQKFLVNEKLAEFWNFGGVRIEDDVVIWAKGNENMSVVPRTVKEIEACMACE